MRVKVHPRLYLKSSKVAGSVKPTVVRSPYHKSSPAVLNQAAPTTSLPMLASDERTNQRAPNMRVSFYRMSYVRIVNESMTLISAGLCSLNHGYEYNCVDARSTVGLFTRALVDWGTVGRLAVTCLRTVGRLLWSRHGLRHGLRAWHPAM